MPWQHEQQSVTVQTITLWLYCPPCDELHYELHCELICDQLSPPQSKPLPLQGNTWLVSDLWNKVQPVQHHLLPTNTSPHPKFSHFPATKRQESKSQLDNKFSAKDIGKRTTFTMPSSEKLLHFLSSSLICAAGVCLLGYGMSADWATADMACGPIGSSEFNGSSSLKIGLFNGTETKITCPRISKLGVKVPGELQIRLHLNICMLDYIV